MNEQHKETAAQCIKVLMDRLDNGYFIEEEELEHYGDLREEEGIAKGLRLANRHVHVAAHDGTDRCAECGEDIRSDIHERG